MRLKCCESVMHHAPPWMARSKSQNLPTATLTTSPIIIHLSPSPSIVTLTNKPLSLMKNQNTRRCENKQAASDLMD
jgi:hypothetical protein